METNLAYKFEEEPREEIIGGKVVMMASPTVNHNRVAKNISYLFETYLRRRKCEYFPDGTSLYLEDGEEYKPDGMVVCDPDKAHPDGIYGAPDLAVEILSPSTARNDKGRKKSVYEKHGVREYWIVSPAEQSVEQYVLENGRFVLMGVYSHYPPFLLNHMTEDEKASLVTEFRCSLFDDLTIPLNEVFYRLAPGV